MPALPKEQLRKLLLDSLAANASEVQVPQTVQGHIEVGVRRSATEQMQHFHLAVRTVTRDTRKEGVWTDRLKIQKTGLAGVTHLDALLGFMLIGDAVIIVSFDTSHHLPVTGSSPNVQFPEQLALDALETGGIVEMTKEATEETVEAFPGEFLTPYLFNEAHTLSPEASTPNVAPVAPISYRKTLMRSPGFVRDVRAMFGNHCAACGTAMDIVEAAHIVPFALTYDNSPENGLCLCPNHHRAFDLADLITFSTNRDVYINQMKVKHLAKNNLLDGWEPVLNTLRPTLSSAPVNQGSCLAQRFGLDTAEGDWIPRSAFSLGA